MLSSTRTRTGRSMAMVLIACWIRPMSPAGETRYELRRDYKPTLLSRQEAAACGTKAATAEVTRRRGAVTPRVLCDPRGPYVGVLTTEEGKRQKSGRQFDVLKIVPRKEEKQCAEICERTQYHELRFGRDYSIGSFAFPKGSPTGGVPDNIYLQGQEDGVVYGLVWNPTKIKAMLCEIVRKQDYMPSEVCEGAKLTSAVNCLAKRRGEHMINRKLMRSTGNRGSVT